MKTGRWWMMVTVDGDDDDGTVDGDEDNGE
jgi:hypothetical protein